MRYLIIFLFVLLLSCSSEQKMLEKCADEGYKEYPPFIIGQDPKNPFNKYLPNELKNKNSYVDWKAVEKLLNKRISEKLKDSLYESHFDSCLNELKYKEKKFKAKYR